jgi:hypothetical protein
MEIYGAHMTRMKLIKKGSGQDACMNHEDENMADKYTIRDFLVYFMLGLFLFISLWCWFGDSLLEFFKLKKININKNSNLIVFLLIPGLYVLGHFVGAIDSFLFRVECCILKSLEGCLPKCFFNILSNVIYGNVTKGILKKVN